VILDVLSGDFDPEKASNLVTGMMVARLDRYRRQICRTLSTFEHRSSSSQVIIFAALYRDIGKPDQKTLGRMDASIFST
jgi:hypothetical protein